jgi:dTDP-4-dehydrorhamnose reductase
MRTMIFGKTGQVARELASITWPKGSSVVQLARADCDIADSGAVSRAVHRIRPDAIVNAAAYTAVDRAESEPDLAQRLNRDAPAAMARACAEVGAFLIHLSSDYVFNGLKQGAYAEGDPVAPLSVYGRTKSEGETAVRKEIERHVILRTSWVFASHGNNFVRTMLRLAAEREEIRVVNDQRGTPTAARDIASAIASIIVSIAQGRSAWGTFHFASGEATTWHDFARAILDESGLRANLIAMKTADYVTAARRPMNSILDCGRIAREYGIGQPVWRQALATVLAELRGCPDLGSGAST